LGSFKQNICEREVIMNKADQVHLVHSNFNPSFQGIRSEVRELSKIHGWRSATAIAFDWTVIFLSFYIATQSSNIAIWILSAVIISGRQHALLVLMHDACHYRLFNSRKWNERISDWFLAYPLFVSTEGFRRDHLPHHLYVFTDKDPEWTRKTRLTEWNFPVKKNNFLVLILKDIFGFSVLKMIKMLTNFSKDADHSVQPMTKFEKPLYYLLLLAVIGFFQAWLFVALWVATAFTLLFAILRIRNIAEHSSVRNTTDLSMSRNIVKPKLWERGLFGPHQVNLHLCHHLYPSVPFYNLPKVKNLLMKIEIFKRECHHTDTYFVGGKSSVLNEVTRFADAQDKNEMKVQNAKG